MKSPTVDRDGYLRVRLFIDGAGKQRLVHRLVLEAFVGPCPDGMEARHVLNNDPADCRLANLRWGTHETNIRDRHAHGTTPRGSSHGMAKLSRADAIAILRSDEPSAVLAGRFNVHKSTINNIRFRRNWSHLEV